MLAFLICVGAIIGFVAFWSLICFVVSLASGWRALAQRFAARGKPAGSAFSMQRAYINSAQYSGCLTIIAAESGLYLSVLPIFPGHAPLLIPWSEIAPLQERKMWRLSLWETRVTLEKHKSVTLSFFSKTLVAAIENKRAAALISSVL